MPLPKSIFRIHIKQLIYNMIQVWKVHPIVLKEQYTTFKVLKYSSIEFTG